jgi:hypothetical protein
MTGDATTLSLLDGTLTLLFENRSGDGLYVALYESKEQGRDLLYSDEVEQFFDRQQQRAAWRNRAIEHLPERLNGEEFERSFDRAIAKVLDSDEKRQKIKRSPAVGTLLDRTEQVTVYPGDETVFRVALTHNGRTESIEFTPGEWTAPNPAPLREKFSSTFYKTIDLDKDAWVQLRNQWEDEQVVREREGITGDRAIAELVRNDLNDTMDVYEEREAVARNDMAAWYDPDPDLDTETYDGGAVIWAPAQVVLHALSAAGESKDFLQTLSREWRDMGVLAGTSKVTTFGSRSSRCRAWPLNVGALAFDPDFDLYMADDDLDEGGEA